MKHCDVKESIQMPGSVAGEKPAAWKNQREPSPGDIPRIFGH